MSPDPELDLLRHAIESFDEQMHAGRVGDWFHPEWTEIVPLRADLEGITFAGPDAPREFVAAARESWESLRFEVREIRRVGSVVFARVHLHARSREAAVEVDQDFGVVASFRDGRISRMHSYTDPDAARVAAEAAEER